MPTLLHSLEKGIGVRVRLTMAQGIPLPEGCEESDHTHTNWFGVEWDSPTSVDEKGRGHGHIPPFILELRWW